MNIEHHTMKPQRLYLLLTAFCLWSVCRAEYCDPEVAAVRAYHAQQMRNFAREQLQQFSPYEYKKLIEKEAREARQKADELNRELTIMESEMRAKENQRIAREQLRDWPRCLAHTAWNRECGGYCTSRDSIFCHSHQHYIPLGEAITGDERYDKEMIAAIIRSTTKIFERETDASLRAQALQRISSALESCHVASATGNSTQIESARKELWGIWHGEVRAIDTRIAERQAQWEREHPEEVAAARRAEQERQQAELSAQKARDKSQTNERIGVIEALIDNYMSAYDQDRPPASLHDLAALRESYNKKDAWGREFLYETDGTSYAICSMGPDGKLNTEDDILVIREIRRRPEENDISLQINEVKGARNKLKPKNLE